ncbi:MAG: hypothetical protein ACOYLQ_09010 [Hyphomicrobiaceae bacterium]
MALIEAALTKLGFMVAVLKDANHRAVDTAIMRHVREQSTSIARGAAIGLGNRWCCRLALVWFLCGSCELSERPRTGAFLE